MNPSYDFSDQVALVTGAGAGMGLDTARAFAAAGAAVVLADVNADAVRTASDELTGAGHRALGVACNVADEKQFAALVDRTVADAEAGQPIGRLGRGDEIAATVLWLHRPLRTTRQMARVLHRLVLRHRSPLPRPPGRGSP